MTSTFLPLIGEKLFFLKYFFLLSFSFHQVLSVTMLPFQIAASVLYKLSFINSATVLNGFIKLTTLDLLAFSPKIPDHTLTFLYQFLESFEVDTDIDLLNNCLPVQTAKDISFLIEQLYGILIEANYIPSFMDTETTQTTEYRAAIAFMQQGIFPIPNSRNLK